MIYCGIFTIFFTFILLFFKSERMYKDNKLTLKESYIMMKGFV